MPPRNQVYWHVAEALIALGRNRGASAEPFTRAQLRAWSAALAARPSAAGNALEHLARSGLVRRVTGQPCGKQGVWHYIVTPEGATAAKAALQAHLHTARSECATRVNQARPRDKGCFAARLWALLRMRRALTAPEAAATLVDAGDDTRQAARTAAAYLGQWAADHPDHIQVSAKRVAGARRFVLVQDLGPAPPPVTESKRARGGAAA